MSIMELDTRQYKPEEQNNIIINAFDSLPVGERVILINDHDPTHVFNQLEEKRFGKFEWEYIEEGPDTWKISLAKKYLNYI